MVLKNKNGNLKFFIQFALIFNNIEPLTTVRFSLLIEYFNQHN